MSTWSDADAFCGNIGSTLPVITDSGVQNVVDRFANDSGLYDTSGPYYLWTDAQLTYESSSCFWLTGEPYSGV